MHVSGYRWVRRLPARLFVAVLLLTSFGPIARAADFVSPLAQVDDARNVHGRDVRCGKPPPPVVSLKLTSRYGNDDSARDDVDQEALLQFNSEMAPLREYLKAVTKSANRYAETGIASHAECTIHWLAAWAQGGALGSMGNHTAEYKRATSLVGLSTAYLLVRHAVPDDGAKALIAHWLDARAKQMVVHFEELGGKRSARNNHRYWAGLAAGLVAVASGDKDLMDWAMATLRLGLCSATSDGALPAELERGKLALHYHLFALNALIPLARLADVNHVSFRSDCEDSLDRIVQFSVRSVFDPHLMEKLSGFRQKPIDWEFEDRNLLAFVALYDSQKLNNLPEAGKLLKVRPHKMTDLGGNVELVYGVP